MKGGGACTFDDDWSRVAAAARRAEVLVSFLSVPQSYTLTPGRPRPDTESASCPNPHMFLSHSTREVCHTALENKYALTYTCSWRRSHRCCTCTNTRTHEQAHALTREEERGAQRHNKDGSSHHGGVDQVLVMTLWSQDMVMEVPGATAAPRASTHT